MLTGSELTALKVADAVFGLKKITERPGAVSLRRQLEVTKSLGFQLKCKYAVSLNLLDADGALAKKLADADSPLMIGDNHGAMPLSMTLRATDVRWPLVALDTDTVKIGSFQVNRITGSQSPEIEVTFLETEDSDFIRTLDAISDFMRPDNGLLMPPAEYALLLGIGLIKGVSDIAWQKTFLVSLQNVALDTSARDVSTLMEIPVTFVQLDPFMPRPTTTRKRPKFSDNPGSAAMERIA